MWAIFSRFAAIPSSYQPYLYIALRQIFHGAKTYAAVATVQILLPISLPNRLRIDEDSDADNNQAERL